MVAGRLGSHSLHRKRSYLVCQIHRLWKQSPNLWSSGSHSGTTGGHYSSRTRQTTSDLSRKRDSADGSLIAITTYSEKGEVILLDAGAMAVIKEFASLHDGRITGVAFSPCCTKLITSGTDPRVPVWQLPDGELIHELSGHTSGISSLAVSSRGLIASGSGSSMFAESSEAEGEPDSSIRLWDLKTGESKGVLTGHEDIVNTLAFSPEGRILASGSGEPLQGHDFSVRLWDVENRRAIARWEDHEGAVNCVAFSGNGQRIASAAWDGSVRIWSADTTRYIGRRPSNTHALTIVAICPNGRFVVSASGEEFGKNPPLMWDAVNGTLIGPINGNQSIIRSVAFSRDSRFVAAGSGSKLSFRDCSVRIWTTDSRQLVAELEHRHPVTFLVYSVDNKYLVTGQSDTRSMVYSPHTLQVWDAIAFKLLHKIESEHARMSEFAIMLRSGMNQTESNRLFDELSHIGVRLPFKSNPPLCVVNSAADETRIGVDSDSKEAVDVYELPLGCSDRYNYYHATRTWACGVGRYLQVYKLEGGGDL